MTWLRSILARWHAYRVERARHRALARVLALVDAGETVSPYVVAESVGGAEVLVDLCRRGRLALRFSPAGERVLCRAGLDRLADIPDPRPEWRDADPILRGEGLTLAVLTSRSTP